MCKRASIVVVAFLFIFTCHPAGAQDTVVYITDTVPYADSGGIPENIKTECTLSEALADWIVTSADKTKGISVVKDNAAVEAGEGRILIVEISAGESKYSGWTGHRKSLGVQGRLLQDGEEIGNFEGYRSSKGGAFGGFKGSCTVLNRCAKVLGEDIVKWLKNPGKDSKIGQ